MNDKYPCMKIQEIIREYVDEPIAQANSTRIDPHTLDKNEREKRIEDGEDPDAEEISQDFPS